MTSKKCAYKGCGLFDNPSNPRTETFYSFPKDPERCRLWKKMGKCPDEVPFSSRYFCSRHFDESKYVAINQRRKQLLSSAVPYPYEETHPKQPSHPVKIIDSENEFQCVVSSVHDIEDEEYVTSDDHDKLHEEEDVSVEVSNEINCVSHTIEGFESYEYQDEEEPEVPETFSIDVEPPRKVAKIGFVSAKPTLTTTLVQVQQPGPSKRHLAAPSTPTSTMNVTQQYTEAKDSSEKEIYEEILHESRDLRSFIYKGEEYIQMPKEDYIGEKVALIMKIRAYEDILKNVKHLLEDVKIE